MRYFLLLLPSLCPGVFAFSQTADTSFYSVVKTGTISGEQKIWQIGTNEYRYSFYFNDRGRGNNVNVVVNTNKDGLVTSLETTGLDYHKNPFHENFAIIGDSAIWNVNGDRRTKKFDGQLYNSSP